MTRMKASFHLKSLRHYKHNKEPRDQTQSQATESGEQDRAKPLPYSFQLQQPGRGVANPRTPGTKAAALEFFPGWQMLPCLLLL